jgi:hypothetical protein
MSESIQTWIQAAIANAAVAACGVRAGGAFHAKSRRQEVSEAQITDALKQVSEASYFLQQSQFLAQNLRWTFEGGQVCCACGRAGTLAVLVLNKGAAAGREIEQLLTSCPALKG